MAPDVQLLRTYDLSTKKFISTTDPLNVVEEIFRRPRPNPQDYTMLSPTPVLSQTSAVPIMQRIEDFYVDSFLLILYDEFMGREGPIVPGSFTPIPINNARFFSAFYLFKAHPLP